MTSFPVRCAHSTVDYSAVPDICTTESREEQLSSGKHASHYPSIRRKSLRTTRVIAYELLAYRSCDPNGKPEKTVESRESRLEASQRLLRKDRCTPRPFPPDRFSGRIPGPSSPPKNRPRISDSSTRPMHRIDVTVNERNCFPPSEKTHVSRRDLYSPYRAIWRPIASADRLTGRVRVPYTPNGNLSVGIRLCVRERTNRVRKRSSNFHDFSTHGDRTIR